MVRELFIRASLWSTVNPDREIRKFSLRKEEIKYETILSDTNDPGEHGRGGDGE
jgi:hypothetical protein